MSKEIDKVRTGREPTAAYGHATREAAGPSRLTERELDMVAAAGVKGGHSGEV